MAAVFQKYKTPRLVLALAVFNATADPALTPGEDYIAAGETPLYIQTKNATINLQVEQLDRELDDATLGYKEQLLVGHHFTIECEVEIAGRGTSNSGSASTPAAYAGLIQMAAFDQDVSSGTHVDHTQLDDDSWIDGTIYFYAAGRSHKLLNAQAEFGVNISNGAVGVFPVTITGIYGGVASASFPAITFNQAKPVKVGNQYTTFTMDGTEYALVNFSLNQNNEVNYTDLPGYEGVSIDDIAPEGEIEILAPAHGDFDPFAIVRAENQALLPVSVVHGTTATNIVTISNPEIQILGVGYGDFEGKRTFVMPFGGIGKTQIRTA
tara:strand:- start:38 stop:1006 length:969 start_codon:yes stop_codon:yes gene_type:complete